MQRYLFVLAFLLVGPAGAQGPVPGSCELGTAQADLNVSDVHARLFNTGGLFFGNGSEAEYLVPRMTGRSPMFAAGIWVGGLVGGEVRVAGADYSDYEFWPGPLDPGATLPDPSDCSGYDRVWTVNTRDVEAYDATGVATPDLADWPVHLGAEVVDGDGVPGNYDLAGGDRPRIYGTQTVFWVMNDVGNAHQTTETRPIGLEVQVHAFAVVSVQAALNRATVYRYTIVNRNTGAFTEARFGMWADPDLGDAADDYQGSDTTRGLTLVYNGDNEDGDGTPPTYGAAPPAVGFDFLDNLGVFMYYQGDNTPLGNPSNGAEMYTYLQARWRDDTPMYANGNGYNQPGFPITTYAFAGNPVVPEHWSERCPVLPCGFSNPAGDRRGVAASRSFDLAAGEARSFHVALLFGQGANHLDSITRLRAASDLIQSAYDAGTLFDTAPPPASLPAPTGLFPNANQYVGQGPVTLSWNAVSGAEAYVVEVWDVAAPASRRSYMAAGTTVDVAGCGTPNQVATCRWRVRADAPSAGAVGVAATETFRMQQFVAGLLDGGGSVIETANPAQPPCPDPGDFGCETYAGEGNTVFRDPNRTADYDVSSTSGRDWGLLNALGPGLAFAHTASPYDYEIRFTEAGGYAIYNAFLGAATPKQIVHVPFEVWNVGTTPADPSDDVRMIPVLRQNNISAPLVSDWANAFVGTEQRVVGNDTLDIPVTEQFAALFPDRPNGYDLFEAAAIGFGGAGATYDPTADGDTQVDLNPATGSPCTRQGYYIGFCARNDQYVPPGPNTFFSAAFVQLLFTDLAMDGTTPPTGTVVRLKMARYPAVANEPPTPAGGARVAIEAVWPNPSAGPTMIRYALPAAGTARVVVYDVLGREVAVLADGPVPAGRREATLDAGRLSPGVYVVALETGAGRAARTFTVNR